MPKKNYLNLKKYCLSLEADLFGVADISGIKKEFAISEKLLKKLDKAICLGMRLSEAVLEDIVNAPTRLYFHHYKIVNAALDQAAFKVANFIQKKGHLALPIPASQIVDWEKHTAHLSHKKIGYLAGLGWIGRNNLLVNRDLGCQFRLVSILTDMPLEPDKPVKENCASCHLCVRACPSEAIKEKPADFNYKKCFEQLQKFQGPRQVEQYVCGMCVRICKGKKQ
jgi:epoxyqueuosine reductase